MGTAAMMGMATISATCGVRNLGWARPIRSDTTPSRPIANSVRDRAVVDPMMQANHDAVMPSSITIDSAAEPVPAVAGNVSTIGAEPPALLTVSRDCMAAANTYSTPSATGVQRMARVTVTNGRCASRATVLALSNPTNDVMASSTAKPTAECPSVAAVLTDPAVPVSVRVNTTVSTAAAATMANTSTVNDIRADSRTPRIINVSASALTATIRVENCPTQYPTAVISSAVTMKTGSVHRPAAGMTSAGSVTITAEGATADTDWPSTSANDSCARCNPDTGELLRIARLLRTVRNVAHRPRGQQRSRVNSEKFQMRIARTALAERHR